MTDWLAFSRACVADLDGVLTDLPTRLEREPVLRAGEGGDDTTAIDAAAEDAVVRRLEELGRDLTLVSEELGIRAFGDGGELRIVVDPIDGSVNAKRAIPFFSLSLAVADGPTMDDVHFGSSTTSVLGRSGRRARPGCLPRRQAARQSRTEDRIEILSLEARRRGDRRRGTWVRGVADACA